MRTHAAETSRIANNHMIDSGKKLTHADKIIEALKVCKDGTFEKIAYYANLSVSQVWKRLSELEDAGLIKKTNKVAQLSSKCNGVVWELKNSAPTTYTTPKHCELFD